MSSNQEIKHPHIEKCALLEEDKFWKNLLMKCARGKYPSRVAIKQNTISYKPERKTTNKSAPMFIIPTDVEEALVFLKKFLLNDAGVRSNKTINNEHMQYMKYMNEKHFDVNVKTLRQEKAMNLKKFMIIKYVSRMCQRDSSIKPDDADRLKRLLLSAIFLGRIDDDDIVIKSNKIVDIKTLRRNQNNIWELVNQKPVEPSYYVDNQVEKEQICLFAAWRASL